MIDYVCTINIVIHTYKIGNSYLKAVKKKKEMLINQAVNLHLIRSINPNINLYTNQHLFINFSGLAGIGDPKMKKGTSLCRQRSL